MRFSEGFMKTIADEKWEYMINALRAVKGTVSVPDGNFTYKYKAPNSIVVTQGDGGPKEYTEGMYLHACHRGFEEDVEVFDKLDEYLHFIS